jgi:hypothetical protein
MSPGGERLMGTAMKMKMPRSEKLITAEGRFMIPGERRNAHPPVLTVNETWPADETAVDTSSSWTLPPHDSFNQRLGGEPPVVRRRECLRTSVQPGKNSLIVNLQPQLPSCGLIVKRRVLSRRLFSPALFFFTINRWRAPGSFLS